jgi:hypothetical protein
VATVAGNDKEEEEEWRERTKGKKDGQFIILRMRCE